VSGAVEKVDKATVDQSESKSEVQSADIENPKPGPPSTRRSEAVDAETEEDAE